MAQITIDIPDDLAQLLAPFQSQFSDLFTRLIATTLLGNTQIERESAPAASLTESAKVPTLSGAA